MPNFATIEDINSLWRELTSEEEIRANALIPVVADNLRNEANAVGKDLDEMVSDSPIYANVVK